jgi:hypothetical protein
VKDVRRTDRTIALKDAMSRLTKPIMLDHARLNDSRWTGLDPQYPVRGVLALSGAKTH